MTTNLYKFYVFDFDGTLVDSMPYFGALMVKILDEAGVSYPDDIVKIITPLGFGGTIAYFRDTLGLEIAQEAGVRELIDRLYPHYRDEIGIKDGVKAFLCAAKAQGVSLNVLTANPHENLDVCLQRLGIYDWFDHVWSSDDFPTTKAQPVTYVTAAERLGTTVDECVFFDDNIVAVTTAMSAGMHGVGVYDPSGDSFAEEFKTTADHYIRSFADVIGQEF
jgi:HAD superfamily hydrolase (TIGR01509 family)